jgi:hypothetical protein
VVIFEPKPVVNKTANKLYILQTGVRGGAVVEALRHKP